MTEIEQEDRDFAGLFSTEQGQRVLEALRATFDPDGIFSEDPYTTAYNCGGREVVKWIEFKMRRGRTVDGD